MREKFLPCHKFDRPFTAWLYELSMDGCDEETGSVDELGYWFGQIGGHVIVEDDRGAVFSTRFKPGNHPDAAAFYAWVEEYIGADRWAEYMDADRWAEYMGAGDEEHCQTS